MTYAITMTSTGTDTLIKTTDCIPTTCDQLTSIQQDDAGILEERCTTSGSNCVCNFTETRTAIERGTFALSGSEFSLTANSDGTGGGGRYCVQGNRLTLFAPHLHNLGGFIAQLVAMKQ
jgi:hypothetical protein